MLEPISRSATRNHPIFLKIRPFRAGDQEQWQRFATVPIRIWHGEGLYALITGRESPLAAKLFRCLISARKPMPEQTETPRADYDEAWKELLDEHLEAILSCFFSPVAAAIAWDRPVVFLDQELREVIYDTTVQSFRVDRLIKVFRRDGAEQWLLVHLEIQSFREEGFAERMYHYNHGIHRAWGRQPVSLVILADLDQAWHPCEYVHEELGCETRFRFVTCKLLEELKRLEHDYRLPAVAAKAQIEALRTVVDPQRRFEIRWRMTRALYDHGFSGEEIRQVYRILSWMMRLPRGLQLTFRQKIVEFEQGARMPYITDIEELGIERGIERAALVQLERVCGGLDEGHRSRVRALSREKAETLLVALLDFRSLTDLDAWLQDHAQV